jgi:hypothetical protein
VGIAHQHILLHSINIEMLFELNPLAEFLDTRIDQIFDKVQDRSSKIAIAERTRGNRNKVLLLRLNIVCGHCPPYFLDALVEPIDISHPSHNQGHSLLYLCE